MGAAKGTGTGLVSFRPSLRTYRREVCTPWQLLTTGLLAVVVVRDVSRGSTVMLALAGCAVLAISLPLALWVLVARVWTTEDAVHRRGLLGRTRVVPRADVASVLWLPGFRANSSRPSGLLVLLGTGRRPLLRLDGTWWGAERLATLAPAVGAPLDVVETDLTAGQLAWRNMYEMPSRHRHPWVSESAVALGVVAAVAAVAILVQQG